MGVLTSRRAVFRTSYMQQTSNTGNVARLAIAQALSMTTMNVNIINTALVGSLLGPGGVAGHAGVVIAICGVNADNIAGVFIDGSVWALIAPSLYWRGSDCRFCRLSPRRCDCGRSFCSVLCRINGAWHCAWMCQFLSLCGN